MVVYYDFGTIRTANKIPSSVSNLVITAKKTNAFDVVLSLLPLSATAGEFVRVCGIGHPQAIHVIARDGSLRSPTKIRDYTTSQDK